MSQLHVVSTSLTFSVDLQGPQHTAADPPVQQAQQNSQDVEQRTHSISGQLQHTMPACSLRAPVGPQAPQANPSVDAAVLQAASHAEQGVQGSEQKQHLPVAEMPATPSSVSASEFSVSRSPMDQLPGISELTEGTDDLTDAELAAAMRAVLSVRRQQVRRM